MQNNIINMPNKDIQIRQFALPSISSVELGNYHNKNNNRNNFDNLDAYNGFQAFEQINKNLNQNKQQCDDQIDEKYDDQTDEQYDDQTDEQYDDQIDEQYGNQNEKRYNTNDTNSSKYIKKYILSKSKDSKTGEIMEIDMMPYIHKIKKNKRREKYGNIENFHIRTDCDLYNKFCNYGIYIGCFVLFIIFIKIMKN